jgi:hypothetical protein
MLNLIEIYVIFSFSLVFLVEEKEIPSQMNFVKFFEGVFVCPLNNVIGIEGKYIRECG